MRRSLHRGDHHLRQICNLLEARADAAVARLHGRKALLGRAGHHLGQIKPGAEMSARAAQHHDPRHGMGAQFAEQFVQRLAHPAADGVAARGAVQRQVNHRTLAMNEDRWFGLAHFFHQPPRRGASAATSSTVFGRMAGPMTASAITSIATGGDTAATGSGMISAGTDATS